MGIEFGEEGGGGGIPVNALEAGRIGSLFGEIGEGERGVKCAVVLTFVECGRSGVVAAVGINEISFEPEKAGGVFQSEIESRLAVAFGIG